MQKNGRIGGACPLMPATGPAPAEEEEEKKKKNPYRSHRQKSGGVTVPLSLSKT